MNTATKTVTANELFRMPDDGFRYELVDGELIQMTPSGGEHGAVVINLSSPLHQHVKVNKLGVVCGAETGYKLRSNPDTVLAPDISFVSAERIPASGIPQTFWTQPPDLVLRFINTYRIRRRALSTANLVGARTILQDRWS
ncbi:MAG: Uma2 family endonuclease [Pyrinomonadaceae bacterium]|nr:Uma2 family endonuclease [Pyrinomonadaceae bacterium]